MVTPSTQPHRHHMLAWSGPWTTVPISWTGFWSEKGCLCYPSWMFCLSVLLSGRASIILTNKVEKLMGQHYKVHMQRTLKPHQAYPALVVYILDGSLPFLAHLHLRMFSAFVQLCRLRHGENNLATQAINDFSSANGSSKP